MNPALEKTWLLQNRIENDVLVSTLGARFSVEIETADIADMTLLDDFDASLWNSDLILCRVNQQDFQLNDAAGCIGTVRAPTKARFWWDLADSDVQRQLKKTVGLRAVMPVASLQLTSARFILRNRDEKIVARGKLLQLQTDNGSHHYLALQPMRGYKREFQQAVKKLEPVFDREIPEFCMKTVLAEQGIMNADNHSGEPLHLTADMPTERAVRAMATEMIKQAGRHVHGVVADTDTVFLHQFRVSVRKLRSLISLLKKSLPPTTVEALSPRLAAIAGKTSRLRDLDVFLLDKTSYRAMLPHLHEAGLDELYQLVEKQRRQEKNRLARYFCSKDYEDEIAACSAELSAPPALLTPLSRKPVLTVAKSLLIKRYRRIQSMSAELHTDSDDEDVHDIRKEFKKLRYLIEFFIDLLPKRRTARLLKKLKRLQVTLGDFNDYCVQIEFLNGFSDDRRVEMTKALSGLVAVLYHRQVETRLQVEEALAQFFTDEMSLEMELAFGAKASGEST